MVKAMNSNRISKLCSDKIKLIKYLSSIGLMKYFEGTCDACKVGVIKLQKDASYKNDKRVWRCGSSYCRKNISIRRGSLFAHSNLKLRVIKLLNV